MQKRIISALSIIFAVATGYGFSGQIIILAGIISPHIAVSVQPVFHVITQFLYTTSILTWASAYTGSIKEVLYDFITPFNPKKEAEKVYDATSNNLKSLYGQQYKAEHLDAAIQNIDDRRYKESKRSFLPRTIKSILSYSPIAYFDPTEREQRANRYRFDVINQLKAKCDNIQTANANIAEEAVAKAELEKNLYPSVQNSIFSGMPYGIVDLMGWVNALGINSIGLVFFGAVPLINALNITSIVYALPIIGTFYAAGALGALGITKKYALRAYRSTTMNISDAHQDRINENIANRKDTVPSYAQVVLSIFMAFSISLGNFLCNIALGEILISGRSLFDPTLMSGILSNPFSVNTFSLYLGYTAAICTFSLVTLLSVNSIYEISAPSSENSADKSTNKNMFARIVNTALFPTMVALVSALISTQAKKILSTHLIPLSISCVIYIALYEYYKTISEKNTLPKLLIFFTSVASTITSYYFGCAQGSLLVRILGIAPARAISFVGACANATLTPSLISSMGLSKNIDEMTPTAAIITQ